MPRVDAVRFLDGDEALRPLGERLRSLDYGDIFPDSSHVELIRRGTLTCSAKSGDCRLALSITETTQSSN